MLKQIEGSLGVAEAVALCRPEIICAYPISPQTHIVENLGAMVKKGSLEDCEFLNVESEFAAMSVGFTSPPVVVFRSFCRLPPGPSVRRLTFGMITPTP